MSSSAPKTELPAPPASLAGPYKGDGGGGDDDDHVGGEDCAPASHAHLYERGRGRERASRRRDGDPDASIARLGLKTVDNATFASMSNAQAFLPSMRRFDTPRPIERCNQDRLRSFSALDLQTRDLGISPIDIDSETGNGEGASKHLLRMRRSKSQRNSGYERLLHAGKPELRGDRVVAGRGWRAGKSGGDGGHNPVDKTTQARPWKLSTAEDSNVWERMPLTYRHRKTAPRVPGYLPLPSADSQALVASGKRSLHTNETLPGPGIETTQRLSGAAGVANPADSSFLSHDYAYALAHLAAALRCKDTVAMRGVLPPFDELVAGLVPALLRDEDIIAINSAASRDPDFEIDEYRAKVRLLVGFLGREWESEAEGYSIKMGVALTLPTMSLPEQAVRGVMGRSEALYGEPLDFAGRGEGLGEQLPAEESSAPFRDFILAGHAYASFKACLMMFAHEPYRLRVENAVGHRAVGETGKLLHPEDVKVVVEELAWVPVELINIVERDTFRLPVLDRIKAFVEDHMNGEGNWAPLSPRVHMLEEGFCRLQWRSPCGAPRHIDVPKNAKERLQAAFASAPAFLDSAPVPSAAVMARLNEQIEARKTRRANRFCVCLEPFFRRWTSTRITHSSVALNITLKQALSNSSATVVHADQDSALPGSSAGGVQDGPQSPGSPRQPAKPAMGKGDDTAADTDGSQNDKKRYLYLCIHRDPPRFEPIDCDQLREDVALFEAIKSTYNRKRGFMRCWFSVWIYDHCDFYEFQKDGVGLFSLCGCGFPDAKDFSYDFEPRPHKRLPPDGPVSAAEFRDRYHHPHGAWGLLSTVWHPRALSRNKGLEAASKEALNSLPKRKEKLEMDSRTRERFFGLLAVETFSYSRLLTYLFALNAPSVVFMILWLSVWGHSGDLQNAAVPLFITLTLSGMFIALVK